MRNEGGGAHDLEAPLFYFIMVTGDCGNMTPSIHVISTGRIGA